MKIYKCDICGMVHEKEDGIVRLHIKGILTIYKTYTDICDTCSIKINEFILTIKTT